jgi:hypothetical protein
LWSDPVPCSGGFDTEVTSSTRGLYHTPAYNASTEYFTLVNTSDYDVSFSYTYHRFGKLSLFGNIGTEEKTITIPANLAISLPVTVNTSRSEWNNFINGFDSFWSNWWRQGYYWDCYFSPYWWYSYNRMLSNKTNTFTMCNGKVSGFGVGSFFSLYENLPEISYVENQNNWPWWQRYFRLSLSLSTGQRRAIELLTDQIDSDQLYNIPDVMSNDDINVIPGNKSGENLTDYRGVDIYEISKIFNPITAGLNTTNQCAIINTPDPYVPSVPETEGLIAQFYGSDEEENLGASVDIGSRQLGLSNQAYNHVAIGSPGNTVGGILNRGSIDVYINRDGETRWQAAGRNLIDDPTMLGDEDGDGFGYDVSISSSPLITVAGSAPSGVANDIAGGYVKVFEQTDTNTVTPFTQKGDTLSGTQTEELFGDSIQLSNDGNIIAISSPQFGDDTAVPKHRGRVQVYEWSNNAWSQRGNDLDGSEGLPDDIETKYAQNGHDIAMSANGNIVAISSPYQAVHVEYILEDPDGVEPPVDLSHTAINAGRVVVYQWDSNTQAWLTLGEPIAGNNAEQIDSGNCVFEKF